MKTLDFILELSPAPSGIGVHRHLVESEELAMLASFGSLSVVPWILFAQSSWNMDAVPVIVAHFPEAAATVEVRDGGNVFGAAAEQRAREALQRAHTLHRAPVLIETVRSLGGAWIADVARRRGALAGDVRLYILVAGEERAVGVIGARHGPASRLTDQQREAIRRVFLGPLQAGKPDEALDRGIREIGSALDKAAVWPGPGVRDGLITAAILLASLAALILFEVWVSGAGRGRRRREVAPQNVGEHLPTSRGRGARRGLIPSLSLSGAGSRE